MSDPTEDLLQVINQHKRRLIFSGVLRRRLAQRVVSNYQFGLFEDDRLRTWVKRELIAEGNSWLIVTMLLQLFWPLILEWLKNRRNTEGMAGHA